MIKFYFDVHVPFAVTRQLRLREIDVLTAQEDEAITLPDELLLARSTDLNRLLFTQDIRFKALAELWQKENRAFGGLVFAHQMRATIGQLVCDLELIAKVSTREEWNNMVEELPLR
ncbi:MAG: DUF5615 family PIN-like protein [Verrucomicrobiota bacterium]